MNIENEIIRDRLSNGLILKILGLRDLLFNNFPYIQNSQINEITPFFIMGCHRSGTTLLRRMLSATNEVVIPPESMSAIRRVIRKSKKYPNLSWNDFVEVAVAQFKNQSHIFKYWDLDYRQISAELHDTPENARSVAYIIDMIYRKQAEKNSPDYKIWGDKTPILTYSVVYLDRVFPNARYIYLLRDGRDAVSSIVEAGIYNLQKACETWNNSIYIYEKILKHKKHFILTYEDLVSNPEENLNSLCEFLLIDYSDTMMESLHHVDKMGDSVLLHHQNLYKKVNSNSIGKWKKRLTRRQISYVERLIGPNLEKYNYI